MATFRAVVLVAWVASASASTPVVEGEVRYGGETWQPADALAYPCDEGGFCVAIGESAFDLNAFRSDGVVDAVDIYEGQPEGARFLVLSFDSDGILRDLGSHGPSGSTNQHDETMLAAYQPTEFSPQRIAGALNYAEGAEAIEIRFDVPVER